ncbi:MAG: hypothetical protein WKG06_06855 [Segetibacter sp.]
MKVKLVSDIVLDPIIKELKKSSPDLEIRYAYEEDIISFLLSNTEVVDEKEVVFIHSDQHFHKKPIEWQKSFLSAIVSLGSKILNPFIISNSLNLSFSSKALSDSAGVLSDADQVFNSYFSKMLQRSNTYVFDFNFCVTRSVF